MQGLHDVCTSQSAGCAMRTLHWLIEIYSGRDVDYLWKGGMRYQAFLYSSSTDRSLLAESLSNTPILLLSFR